MKHLAAALSLCLLGGVVAPPRAPAQAQPPTTDPTKPVPIPVPVPPPVPGPAPVPTPAAPPVAIPTPTVTPTPTPNPIGNPIGNPLGNVIGNPIGNPIATPIGDVIGNPIATPDVTTGPNGRTPSASQPGAAGPRPGAQFQAVPDGTTNPTGGRFRLYVGTYTNDRSKSEGIYRFDFDAGAGTLSNPVVAAKLSNPSFLAIHPSGRFVYAVNEDGQTDGKPTGGVTALGLTPDSGDLTPLNVEASGGAHPCYITIDATGGAALVANYSGGSVSVLPIGSDGRLGPPRVTAHRGSSVDPNRQTGPHAHAIDLDRTNRLAFVPDLGLDRVLIYDFNPQTGTLVPNIPTDAALPPGSGPRHLAFSPDQRHAYVISEMASTITVFAVDRSRGALNTLQTVSTRPAAPSGGQPKPNSTAEVVVHPSGRFVYGSNRGDDSLAIFAANRASGQLTLVGFQPTGGRTPRNVAIDPTGQFLLAGNQDSNTITVFRIDPNSGRLAPIGGPVPCPAPVCLRFTAAPGQ